jgi:type II restriction/modification system DNA methylase subunit YeeA
VPDLGQPRAVPQTAGNPANRLLRQCDRLSFPEPRRIPDFDALNALIFKKINGYHDGSFYTPGFITEYMCRETICRAVLQKFRADEGVFAGFDSAEYDDLKNYLARDNYKEEVIIAANALVNSVTICDPAVGSGHFLVSTLNELIATKSDLGILASLLPAEVGADAGAKTIGIRAEVANDELLLSDRKTGELYEYRVTTLAGGKLSVQAVQQTLFHEKRTLIENHLFGVDLNPNSVKICRLRLWIELLKSAYYQFPVGGWWVWFGKGGVC